MRLKGGGPSEEEKVEEVQLVAAEEVRSPAPKRTQYGLQKFFGTPEQKASAQPVLAEQVVPYQRKSKSRTQLEAEAAREHYLDLVAAEEAAQGDEAHALEVAKRRKLSQGARFTKLAAPKRKIQAGPKLELTANKKLSIVKMLQESKPEFADLASYWKAMEQRTGLSKRQLKHFLGTAKKLQETAELPLKKFNTKNRRMKRLSGAGRKVPFPEEVAQLKQWLEVERACGHTVGKSDLLREFCTILRATAQQPRMLFLVLFRKLRRYWQLRPGRRELRLSQPRELMPRASLRDWSSGSVLSSSRLRLFRTSLSLRLRYAVSSPGRSSTHAFGSVP